MQQIGAHEGGYYDVVGVCGIFLSRPSEVQVLKMSQDFRGPFIQPPQVWCSDYAVCLSAAVNGPPTAVMVVVNVLFVPVLGTPAGAILDVGTEGVWM